MDDEIIEYLQFPKFLISLKLGTTAKLVYMLLYNRCRLSEAQGWNKDGKVYCVYPAAEIAEHIGTSRKTVVNCIKELKDAGLLETSRRGPANICFVKVPTDREENFSYYEKKTSLNKGRKLPLSNYKKVTKEMKKAPKESPSSSPKKDLKLVYDEVTGMYEYQQS